jgi:hypothetical protein
MHKTYQHKLLKDGEIRLVDLFTLHDQLVVNIRHIQLKDAEDNFQALSYVWGGPLNKFSLLCADGGLLLEIVNLRDALPGGLGASGSGPFSANPFSPSR